MLRPSNTHDAEVKKKKKNQSINVTFSFEIQVEQNNEKHITAGILTVKELNWTDIYG